MENINKEIKLSEILFCEEIFLSNDFTQDQLHMVFVRLEYGPEKLKKLILESRERWSREFRLAYMEYKLGRKKFWKLI